MIKPPGDKGRADHALAEMMVKQLLKSSGAFAAHDAASGQAQDAFVDVVAGAVARQIDLRLPTPGEVPARAPAPFGGPHALARLDGPGASAARHGVHGPADDDGHGGAHDDGDGASHAHDGVPGGALADVVLGGAPGRLSSDFGPRRDPFTHRSAFHHGVDIAAPLGTPLHAAGAGVVVHAGPAAGYGNLVEVEGADGVRVRYAHADRVDVHVGDVVSAGDALGTVGNSGRSTGPHVHIEVRDRDGDAVDPETALWVARASTRAGSH